MGLGAWGCTSLYIVNFFRVVGKNSCRLISKIAKLASEIHYAGEHVIFESLTSVVKPERLGMCILFPNRDSFSEGNVNCERMIIFESRFPPLEKYHYHML